MLGDKKNPFSVVPKIKTNALKEDTSSKRPFTQEELSIMLNQAMGWLKPAIFIGFYSGLRLSDVITLKWSEIDLNEGFITRHMRKTSKQQILYVPEIVSEMLSWKDQNKNTEYVFQEQAETYLGLRNYLPTARSKDKDKKRKPDKTKASKLFQAFLTNACKFNTKNYNGQTILGFHSLRVSNATFGKNTGEAESVIQSRLGHSDSKVTSSYIQQSIEDKKRELKSGHISLPLSSTDSNSESLKITELKNKIMSLKTNTYKEFIKKLSALIK